jgi:hypothetical protein
VTRAPSLLVARVLIGPGTEMSGGVSSADRARVTMTLKLLVARLSAASCAEHLTVVLPILNTLPEGGSQRGWSGPSRLSITETL